jgi:hypothetical protein
MAVRVANGCGTGGWAAAVVGVRASSDRGSCAFHEQDLGAFGEPLGYDLGVERIRKDLGPVLEGAVGGDGGRASVIVTLGDDLECELGLSGIHARTTR